MTQSAEFNALTINSNLAQPILKAPNDTFNTFIKRYLPEPAEDLTDTPFLAVPEDFMLQNTYGVYGFRIPEVIRLRVLASAEPQIKLSPWQEETISGIFGLGRATTFEIANPNAVRLEGNLHRFSRPVKWLSWSISGEATSPDIEGAVLLSATHVRGHKIHNAQQAGKVVIDQVQS